MSWLRWAASWPSGSPAESPPLPFVTWSRSEGLWSPGRQWDRTGDRRSTRLRRSSGPGSRPGSRPRESRDIVRRRPQHHRGQQDECRPRYRRVRGARSARPLRRLPVRRPRRRVPRRPLGCPAPRLAHQPVPPRQVRVAGAEGLGPRPGRRDRLGSWTGGIAIQGRLHLREAWRRGADQGPRPRRRRPRNPGGNTVFRVCPDATRRRTAPTSPAPTT